MREILFRGKRLTTGEWTCGYLLADTADCKMKMRGECVCPHDRSIAYILTWIDEFHEYGYVEVDPSTVGQYTGLKDKNGKRIFEGDIIRWTDWESETYEMAVVYDPEWNRFAVFPNGVESLGVNKWLGLGRVEVVGTIHDHPELLEGGS